MDGTEATPGWDEPAHRSAAAPRGVPPADSLALVIAAVIVLILAVLPAIRRRREVVFQKEEPF